MFLSPSGINEIFMKKELLSIAAIFSVAFLFAQPGLYFNISGGYGWSAPQQNLQVLTFQPSGTDPANSVIIPLINQNISDSASLKFQANKYQGYATGGNINAVVGYMITNYIGVEMGFGGLIGKKLNGKSVYDDPTVLGNNASIVTNTWSYGVTLSPGIRIHACKPGAKVVPFGRFALTLPVWGKTIHELDITSSNFLLTKMPASAKIRTETESVASIGFNGSIGVGYNITKWLRVYGEVLGNYLFVRIGENSLKRYDLTFKGETSDWLPTFSKYSSATEFVDKLDENSNTTIYGKKRKYLAQPGDKVVDEDKPRQVLRSAANFSAFGFNVGLTFTINNTAWKKKKNKQFVPVHQ
ncbi:MAG TPA: outer membrane beta-barrel protein [Chitinophagales bacterium]|nr:outer membrane beta-barrel protein [Chitinophagales bacterium]